MQDIDTADYFVLKRFFIIDEILYDIDAGYYFVLKKFYEKYEFIDHINYTK